MDIGLIVVTLALMLIGLLGVVIPFLPGLPVILLAAVLYGWATEFGTLGSVVLAVMTVLAIAGVGAGAVLPHRKVMETGAPKSTIFIGLALGIVGFFVIPIVGFLVGAAGGVLLAEKSRTGEWATAAASTKSLVVGFGIGKLLELTMGLAMIALWVGWVLSN